MHEMAMLRLLPVLILLAPGVAIARDIPRHSIHDGCARLRQQSDIDACIRQETIHADYVKKIWAAFPEGDQEAAEKVGDADGAYSGHWYRDVADFLEGRFRSRPGWR